MDRFDVSARRIRCYGHILNLVGRAFLYSTDEEAFLETSDQYVAANELKRDLEHWRSKGPVGKLHNVVKFIRASPQRCERFLEISQEDHDSTDFTIFDESPAELKLMLNNDTRWNSTYMMIQRALVKQEAIDKFIYENSKLKDPSKKLSPDDYLTEEDWHLFIEIQEVLAPLYEQTIRCQGRGKSDGHGRLWEVLIDAIDLTVEQASQSQSQSSRPTRASQRGSQRINRRPTSSQASQVLLEAGRVATLRSLSDPPSWARPTMARKSMEQPRAGCMVTGIAAFISASRDEGSELDQYYRMVIPQPVVDPVKWWIDHRQTFPTLSKLALDILAIPPMAMVCEQAFNEAISTRDGPMPQELATGWCRQPWECLLPIEGIGYMHVIIKSIKQGFKNEPINQTGGLDLI
ncbi:hypothetical protein CGCF413_v010406 [Colletotrichum fructicola]|nr:hypothetical protein CGCF413_v010406 [Colletotrichum fructicola]